MSMTTACGADDQIPTTTASEATSTTGPTPPDTTDTSASTTATTGAPADPWMTPYCYTVAAMKWLAPWIDREQQVLERVNQARAAGADCGSTGDFAPAGPLTVEPRLHCAARRHAQDMAERDFNDHINPDGEGPLDRIHQAGYTSYAAAGENLAAGSDDPEFIVQGWLASDEHCANLMNPQYEHTGIGFYEGPGALTYYWTHTFAAPLK